MNTTAFQKLSYGLYLITTKKGDRVAGCVINTFAQVTATPSQVTIAINKGNYTTQIINEAGYFTGVALSQAATMELIGAFGFHCSKDYDKFKGLKTGTDMNGIPYVSEQVSARFSCKVLSQMDVGSHIVFLAEVQDCDVLSDDVPMTYAYYHTVKNGVTPPKASSYNPEPAKNGYRCNICGYVLESDTIPKDFVCPVCGRGAEEFKAVTK